MATKSISYDNKTFDISYTIVNNSANKNMLFLHGWGSNKVVMQRSFCRYFRKFNHIYLDLPGFGDSYNDSFLDSFAYAQVVESFLQKIHINDTYSCDIVVGHSFGGKIALLLNREIILLGSAGILLQKSIKVKTKILMAKFIKKLGISNIARKWLVAEDAKNLTPVMYDIFKYVVNEDFSKQYASFKQSATIFWGQSDTTTPMESFYAIQSLMPVARFYILQGDHYFFLQQGKEIENLYYNSVDNI